MAQNDVQDTYKSKLGGSIICGLIPVKVVTTQPLLEAKSSTDYEQMRDRGTRMGYPIDEHDPAPCAM